MKRWVVRLPALADGTPLPDIVMVADNLNIEGGVLIFTRRLRLVRAFGVGQWHNVEPLADVPEPTPSQRCGCGHHQSYHAGHGKKPVGHCEWCECREFGE